MGVGQRLLRRAAHLGGVIVVDRADLVNLPLVPAYRALGYQWDPSATGAIADEVPANVESVKRAVRAAFEAAGHELVDAAVDADTAALAEAMIDEHDPAIA
jgi:hypothetical protein